MSNEETKQRKRKPCNNEKRGIDTTVYSHNDLYPKWAIELMEEINPDKTPKPTPPKYQITDAGRGDRRPQRPQRPTRTDSAKGKDNARQGRAKQRVSDELVTYVNLVVQTDNGVGIGAIYRKQADQRQKTVKTASLYSDSVQDALIKVLDEVNDSDKLVLIRQQGLGITSREARELVGDKYGFNIVIQTLSPRYHAERLIKLADNALRFKDGRIYKER